MKRDDESTTQFWVRQIQEQARRDAIEECAKVCEARIRGNDGLPGGNDWGHQAPYNCEATACAKAIRDLVSPVQVTERNDG